jgi:cytochrome c biogenesis protein CcdA
MGNDLITCSMLMAHGLGQLKNRNALIFKGIPVIQMKKVNSFLSGTKLLLVAAALLTFIILPSYSQAAETCGLTPTCPANANNLTLISGQPLPDEGICIYFFYGQGCQHCARVEPVIEGLVAKYPEVKLKKFEVYFNTTSQDLFADFNKRYDIKQRGVPSVFIGDRAFVGDTPIIDNLEKSINYYQQNKPVCPETYNKVEASVHQINPPSRNELTLTAIITAALVDSINPCAFSVLIFMLVYLLALGSKKKMLKVGITYIVVIFIVYFLSGLGLFTVIQSTGLTRTIYFVAAIIAIIAGLINVKDFFWYGKGISLVIPESRKPLIQKYIQQATVPAAIVLGVLVSLFELPCTGGVYLAILSLLSSKMSLAAGIPYLLLYNFIFVVPLFVILFIIYKGLSPEKAEAWRLQKRTWMKLAMGLVMIALGIIMLAGWI